MTVTISQLKSIVSKIQANPQARATSLAVWGPPGIGKTQLAEQIAETLGARCKVYLTATMDPTDVVGVPHPDLERNITKFLPPEDFICLTEEGEPKDQGPTVALFDDMPTCKDEVFAALYRMFQQREVGGRKIRDNVLLIATGNRAEDNAGAQDLPTALANRFVHFVLRVDNDEWRRWAVQNDVVEEIVAFIRAKGDMLHQFDPKAGFVAFPTPRSVAKASDLVKAIGMENTEDLKLALMGCCGEGWATTFMMFDKVRNKLIPASEIIKNPEEVRVPEESEIDVMFATITSLTYYLKKKPTTADVIAALTYTKRLPHKEMSIVLAKDIVIDIVMDSDNIDFRTEVLMSEEFRTMMPAYRKYLKESV
jgi:hypothetical protein